MALSWMFALFLCLVLFNIPIAFSMGICSLIYLLSAGLNPVVISLRIFTTLDSFTLLALPFFLLAGNLMNTAGITDRILMFARSLVGHITGGLGQVSVVAEMIVSGISGSGVADAAGLGVISMEMMTKAGYDEDFSAGLVLAGSTLGPIIPPSIIMVIYALSTGVSMGRLLIAGFIPGGIMGVCLMVLVYFIARKKNYPRDQWLGFKQVIYKFSRTIIALLTAVILFGGIVTGIFTVTEASAVACLYALIIGIFVYKELRWRNLIEVFLETAYTTGLIGMVIGICGLFSWILAKEGVPQALADFILSLTTNKYLILLMVNVGLLIAGCFVDAGPLIIISAPALIPLLERLNIDLVYFGVVMSVNVSIGMITPPVGTCLYAVMGITGIPMERLAKAVYPFLIALIVSLLIITYIPQISLFLPNLLFGEGQ